MTFPLDEKEFMQNYLLDASNPSETVVALGKATVQTLNWAYHVGVEAGRREREPVEQIGAEATVALVRDAEIYRAVIRSLINRTNDIEYLKAVYSFAEAYPHDAEGHDKEPSLPRQEGPVEEIADILKKVDLKTQEEVLCFVKEYCSEHGCTPKTGTSKKLEPVFRFAKRLME